MLAPVILLVSFVPLLAGARMVVRGASSLAVRFGVPSLVIGLTLVAFGTSAPELVINVSAALAGQDSIAIGNVLGSNIFNIAGVLGVVAVVRVLPISRSTTWAEIPLAFLAAAVLLVMMADQTIDGEHMNVIRRSEGLVLLVFFLVFLGYIGGSMRADTAAVDGGAGAAEAPDSSVLSPALAAGAAGIGFLLLAAGGRGVVYGATGTAQLFGIPEYIIAVTVVAIGTSLPELVTSLVAARRGETDIAVGNAVGSNIFNVFLVLGTTATIRPIVAPRRALDHGMHLLVTALLFLFVFTGRGRKIERWEGLILVVLYLGYTAALVVFR
jgi:cation:H+ antiporter